MNKDKSTSRTVTQEIASMLAGGEAKPLGEERWAEIHERLWAIIDELKEENDRLKLSLLLHANQKFSN
jgi:hypothetical protein